MTIESSIGCRRGMTWPEENKDQRAINALPASAEAVDGHE
jgi:hypothetical protein